MDHAHVIDYRKVELHRNDVVVLRNINLTVDAGELLYLTGKVGSGKSTFLKSLYSEIPIAAGQASCLGYDLVSIKRKQIPLLRREVGIVFQDFRLLNDRSVFDNLMFVLKATGWSDRTVRMDRIEQVLKEVVCSTKVTRCPTSSRAANSSELSWPVPCSTSPS